MSAPAAFGVVTLCLRLFIAGEGHRHISGGLVEVASCSGLPINCRNCATALYSAAVRCFAVIVHRLAPPMIELIGFVLTSGSIGRYAAAQLNFAIRAIARAPPTSRTPIAACAGIDQRIRHVSRPPYLKLPSFAIAQQPLRLFDLSAER